MLPLIIPLYHYFWTISQFFYCRVGLKMIPITYWSYRQPSIFLFACWIGDAGLLLPGITGMSIGIGAFSIAHLSEIGMILYHTSPSWLFPWWGLFLIWVIPASQLKFLVVLYGIILGLHLDLMINLYFRSIIPEKKLFGGGLMFLSDILIGMELLWGLTIPGADTITLGLYWIGLSYQL